MTDGDETGRAHFTDKRNITVGQARLIWAKAVYPSTPEGWDIPGGGRITSPMQAHEYAARMNVHMQELLR